MVHKDRILFRIHDRTTLKINLNVITERVTDSVPYERESDSRSSLLFFQDHRNSYH